MLSTGQGVLGHNTYAYCRNNVPSRIDTSGKTDEEIHEGGLIGNGYGEGDIPTKIAGDYLTYSRYSDNHMSFEEYVDQQIDIDLKTYVIAYHGYNSTFQRDYNMDIGVDFDGWENLREEIELTSKDEIVKRIVRVGREKYEHGFGDKAPLGVKYMERLVSKALDNYLSAYETSFLRRLFTRPFPWLFRSEEEVRRQFGYYYIGQKK